MFSCLNFGGHSIVQAIFLGCSFEMLANRIQFPEDSQIRLTDGNWRAFDALKHTARAGE